MTKEARICNVEKTATSMNGIEKLNIHTQNGTIVHTMHKSEFEMD